VAEGTDVRTVADLGSRRWAFCEYFKTDTTIIIGSQALLVGWPNAPAIMRTSVEIDAYPCNAREWEVANPGAEASEEISVLFGYLSDFHIAHGFYIDDVDETTACLPPGWRERAVSRVVHSYGRMVTAIAPATNDLIVSKLHPLREKDKSFILACHQAKPLDIDVIRQLLADTLPSDQVHGAATAFLDTLN
jgi:hypothetical protein